MSNQAGQSNLIKRLTEMGLGSGKGRFRRLARILDVVKQREKLTAMPMTARRRAFELLARSETWVLRRGFFRGGTLSCDLGTPEERKRRNRGRIRGCRHDIYRARAARTSFFKNEHAFDMQDDGPVNALWQALKSDLGPHQSKIEDVRLTDFKVRITQGGTEAVTRVIIDFADDRGRFWSTVGVSANIVDASFEALLDAVNWKLMRGDTVAEAAE